MTRYVDMNPTELATELEAQKAAHAAFVARGLSLNMARGKPSKLQLDLSMQMLTILNTADDCIANDGTDCRNYGVLEGIPEARTLMASMLEETPENVIVFGNSSLNVMYDTVARCMAFGCLGHTPWKDLPQVKWLCPVPGYDRHFTVTQAFNIEMLPVPLLDDGPDMDTIETLVANDDTIKGIWCVPQYSNPSGITYADDVVKRLASMTCAAPDFRIFWDNAYCVHHLYSTPELQDSVYDIGEACREAGNPNRYFKFCSTSKITFPGAGISAFGSSPDNIAETVRHISAQMIGHDKLNQLRHVKFLRDMQGIHSLMDKHADILRPKFELVAEKLHAGLDDAGIGNWTDPRGGYFVSFDGMDGTAKRIVELAAKAGVVMTNAGATWPYGRDPHDSNIRIAPSLPPLEELDTAMDVFITCVKLATLERLQTS